MINYDHKKRFSEIRGPKGLIKPTNLFQYSEWTKGWKMSLGLVKRSLGPHLDPKNLQSGAKSIASVSALNSVIFSQSMKTTAAVK